MVMDEAYRRAATQAEELKRELAARKWADELARKAAEKARK